MVTATDYSIQVLNRNVANLRALLGSIKLKHKRQKSVTGYWQNEQDVGFLIGTIDNVLDEIYTRRIKKHKESIDLNWIAHIQNV